MSLVITVLLGRVIVTVALIYISLVDRELENLLVAFCLLSVFFSEASEWSFVVLGY